MDTNNTSIVNDRPVTRVDAQAAPEPLSQPLPPV